MGNSGSKATDIANTLTQQSTTIATSILNSCATSSVSNQSQVVNDTNLFGSLSATQTQTVSIDMNCATSSNIQQSIAQNVSNNLAQQATAAGAGIISSLGASQSVVAQNLQNIISSTSTTDIANQMSANLTQTQGQVINTSGILKMASATQDQSVSVVASALINTTGYINAINTTANAISQTTTATTTNPIADLINAVGTSISSIFSGAQWIIIAVVIVAAIIGYVLYSQGAFSKYGIAPAK